ncbi:MAG: response regulator [Nitrospirae bacterium]|nr:response regulator [Nitrospirota bacterium]
MENSVQNKKMEVSLLYVEDEPITRELVTKMLRRKVATLHIAENGKEGLELFKQYRPDMVITDISMPVMDGIAMTKEIRSLDKNAIIMLTTAHSDTGLILNAIEIGIDRYILKPVDMATLLAAVEKSSETVLLQRTIQRQNREKDELIAKLRDALDHVKILSGLLPICASCKKIRDDKGYWSQIEEYISEHSEAEFSHGICPDCMKKLYPELYSKYMAKKETGA